MNRRRSCFFSPEESRKLEQRNVCGIDNQRKLSFFIDMKISPAIKGWMSIAASTWCLLVASAFGQEVTPADTLSPSDIGAYKYLFESKAPKGSVVVYRAERFEDGRLTNRYEKVSNTPNEKHVEEVILFLSDFLRGTPTTKLSDTAGGSLPSTYQMQSIETFSKPESRLKITFLDKLVKATTSLVFIYTIKNESFDEVKRRVPKLPALSKDEWTYASPTIFKPGEPTESN